MLKEKVKAMEEVIQKYENTPMDSQTITPDQYLVNKLAFENHLNDKTNGYILLCGARCEHTSKMKKVLNTFSTLKKVEHAKIRLNC